MLCSACVINETMPLKLARCGHSNVMYVVKALVFGRDFDKEAFAPLVILLVGLVPVY